MIETHSAPEGANSEGRRVGETPVHRSAPASLLPSEVVEDLLCLADDEFVIGHRHSEWLGLSPFLEEDLTLASIAQDELGHARELYALIWPDWAGRDAHVTRRPSNEWRSCGLVERENGSWEFSFIRKWAYDLAEPHRWNDLGRRHAAAVPALAALVSKVLLEERFHQRHAESLLTRLVTVPDAKRRLTSAFAQVAPYIPGLIAGLPLEVRLNFAAELVEASICGDFSIDQLAGGDTGAPELGRADRVSRRTRHAEFGSIAQSINDVVAFDPDASW